MKIKFLLWLVFFLNCFAGFSQEVTLKIAVMNEKSEAVQNATVSLFELPANKLIRKKVLQGEGTLSLESNRSYLVRVTAVGIHDTSKMINVLTEPFTVTIIMATKISSLGNVTVVSKKPLIKQDDDKTVIDAEPLSNSSTNAYEVLEKTPSLVVDQDGNVYLNSTTPATVYINGREMKLSSADLASLLKSLPAGSVSKIEILRTPSAKYDASGSGGIVNIVLKKGVKIGTNGSLNAGYFQGKYGTSTVGINLNKSAGKITSYLSYQFTDRNNFEELNSSRLIRFDSSLLEQKAYTTYPTTNHYVGAGIDIALTKNWTIGYDARLTPNIGRSHALNKIDILNNDTRALLGKNESAINNKNNSTFIGNNFSAKYKIDSVGSDWNTQFDYNYYNNSNSQVYINYSSLPALPAVSGDGENKNSKNIFVGQTDLTLKLVKKYTLETGFKATISNSRNSSQYFKDTGNYIKFPDPYQTNTFKYNETIGAGYLQISATFAGFIFKPGIRLETTDINGKQIVPKDTSFSIKRTDLFPYLFIRHKLFKIFGFPLVGSAIYRKSIKRPYYETLNPYPKYIDQYLFDVGNPQLKPQFTTNYELNATYTDIPVFAVGINKTKDIFSNVTYQDNITKIAYRTYDNLGSNMEYYFKVIGGIPPGGKYFFYAGVQYNYNQYKGFYQGRPLNFEHGSWLFFMYQQVKATKTITVDMQGFMRSKGLQNLYELNTFGGLYVSVNKSILKKKANIIVSVNDLLRTNHVNFKLNQGDVSAIGERINDTRRIGLTLRYNFGIKPKEEKKGFDVPVEN
ncbi:MAG: outer membrane beta-barrel protein [Ferruginibacter sp.]